MNEHTPGPWEFSCLDDTERPGIEADRFSVVIFGVRAEDDCGIHGRTEKEEMANARLIAAAPDLLEALESVMDTIEWPPDSNCSCHISPPCNDCVNYAGLREAIAEAKAAIAKAKGETP